MMLIANKITKVQAYQYCILKFLVNTFFQYILYIYFTSSLFSYQLWFTRGGAESKLQTHETNYYLHCTLERSNLQEYKTYAW